MTDNVNSPAHYALPGGMEVIDIILDRSAHVGGREGYLYGNAIKYLLRYPLKERPVEDLKKCIKHLEWLIEMEGKK